MGYKVDFNCKIRWAQLSEQARDEGPKDGSDLAKKIESQGGLYKALLVMDDQTKEFLLSKGVSNKGMHGQLWGTDEEGNITYKVKRPHINPNLKDDNGDPLYMGPPTVLFDNGDGTNRPWDWSEDGLIGNDSEVKVRLDVYSKEGRNINTLELVKVTDLVPYEGSGAVPDVEEF